MKKIIFLTILSVVFYSSIIAQFHDNIWLIGRGDIDNYSVHQLDFNNFPVSVTKEDKGDTFFFTTSSFCDSLGNLLFYTNGTDIRNREHKVVEGGEVINPGMDRDQFSFIGYRMIKGAFFLPLPDNDSLVYLIHTTYEHPEDGFEFIGPEAVYYSIINIKANSGLGKVVKDNQLLIDDLILPPTAVKHANGRDWWLIIPRHYESYYYIFLLDSEGFKNHLGQDIGSFEIPDSLRATGVLGLQNTSPNGEKYVDFRAKGVSLYDFDRCKGELSNEYRFELNHQDTITTGDVSFSPNNQFLYTTSRWSTLQDGSDRYNFNRPLLIQYDLNAISIPISADTIGRRDSLKNILLVPERGVSYGGLNLAPDGRIYSFTFVSGIQTIMEPNKKGSESRLLKRFPVVDSGLGPANPYYPNYRLGPLDGSPCDTLGIDNHPRANYRWENWDTLNELHIEFADLSYYEPAEWFWEFEDLGTSRDTNPEFTFPAPGIYEVCLTVSNVNSTHTTCKNVPVGEGVVDIDYVFEENEPTVYPNPTSNAFQVYLPTSQSIDVQLFDASGRQVLEQSGVQSGEQIDVSLLPKGIYFYHFRNEENEAMHIGKLVVV